MGISATEPGVQGQNCAMDVLTVRRERKHVFWELQACGVAGHSSPWHRPNDADPMWTDLKATRPMAGICAACGSVLTPACCRFRANPNLQMCAKLSCRELRAWLSFVLFLMNDTKNGSV